MRKFATGIVLLMLLVQTTAVRAQDFFVNADLVSSFVCRGMKCNDFSFQPSVGFSINYMFNAIDSYTFSEKLPLTLFRSTIFVGADYNDNQSKRSSSYIRLAYPFTVKGFDLQAEVGVTPWEGMYSDKLIVNSYTEQTRLAFTLSI